MKRLLSLILLLPVLGWAADNARGAAAGAATVGVEETKGDGAIVAKLTFGTEEVGLTADQVKMFGATKAALESDWLELDRKQFLIDQATFTPEAFKFLKAYLQTPGTADQILLALSGEQIIDILQLLDYLQIDFTNPVGQRLQSKLIQALKNKLSPKAIILANQTLSHLPGVPGLIDAQLFQVAGESVGFSPDGSRIWIKNIVAGRHQFQFYQITDGVLVPLGDPVPGNLAGFSLDDGLVWIKTWVGHLDEVQFYQIRDGALAQLGVPFASKYIGFSPDGSLIWISNQVADEVQFYQIRDVALVPLGAPIAGCYVGFSSDGSRVWVRNWVARQEQIQFYQTTDDALISLGAPVAGKDAGFSPDGSRVWVHNIVADRHRIQFYQITDDALISLGRSIAGNRASFNPDDSRVWVHNIVADRHRIQFYQIIDDALISLGRPIFVSDVGISPDGSLVWTQNTVAGQDQIQFFLTGGDGLASLNYPIAGSSVGFSPDGNLVWIENANLITFYHTNLLRMPDQKLSFVQQLFVLYLMQIKSTDGFDIHNNPKLAAIFETFNPEMQRYLESQVQRLKIDDGKTED